jgi:hypothetical protein
MAYKGQTYSIPCDGGGFNHNKNIDSIPPNSMIDGTKNINLHEGGKQKRGGTSKYNSAEFVSGLDIMGMFNFIMKDGTNYLVIYGSNGFICYTTLGGATTFTSLSGGYALNAYASFAVMDDLLYCAIEGSTPTTWDGAAAAVSDMTDIPASWTGTVFPKQFVVHGFGASVSMWAFGFVDGTVYCSKDSDGTDFSDAEVLTIQIYTDDGYGIVGGFEYGDRLFAVGRKQVYIIDDTNADRTKWGYQSAQWKGGAAHHRLIVKTPNDVVLMSEDGEIYSVVAAENYGDYKAASLARPARMDNWIRQNLNLAQISKFHAVYDPTLRAILFFVVRSGMTSVDTCLTYFIDREPIDAWTIHDNTSSVSGYSACSSALVNPSVGVFEIWTGDYDSFVWKLNQSSKNDNSNAFMGKYKTPVLHFDNPRITKHYNSLRVILKPVIDTTLSIDWWVDDVQQTAGSIVTGGGGTVLGSFVLDTSLLGGISLQDESFQLGRIGKRIQFAIYNNAVDEDFFISQLLIDFKPLGARDD